MNALDLLSHLSLTTWGADRATLTRLHFYGRTSPRALRMLGPIQTRALHLVTGAFRSSPIPSLQVDAHILRLDRHRESLATRAFLRPQHLPELTSPLLDSHNLA